MWKLRNTTKDHWEHFVFVGDDCVVGRKDATLLVGNDPSVSRKHAVLFVKHPEENLGNTSKKSSLFLRDEGSKYGTFKNSVRITNEEELADGDIIKFGQFESVFRVHYVPLVITTSCLDVSSKNELKKTILHLGGHLVSEWQPLCTHLVMSQVKVTIKALCCLVSLKPIVLPDYFEELEKKLKSSATVVPPNEFIPPIGESLIDKDKVSFDVNPQRKSMFNGKTFFFLDEKQFKKLHLGIIMGGGKASIITGNVDTESLVNENTCFIEPVKSQVKEETLDFLKEIISALQKKSLRMIPESDIGLAVTYASTDTFCNPSFNVGSVVLGSQKIPSQTLSEREVYVPDTGENSNRPSSSKRNSLLNLENQPRNKKQKLEAPDSLNLTSFRTDEAEDIFEIPLSAQVKKELNDIFEETMKAEYQDPDDEVEELPSTLPLQPVVEVSHVEEQPRKEVSVPKEAPAKRLKVEQSTSFQNENQNENRMECITTSPRRPKIERNISLVNGNGFENTAVNGENEDNLPRNLIKIEFAALVVRAPRSAVSQPIVNSNVKNFKKFKKVLPKKAQVLPRIIGGHDLVPYDRDAAKFCENSDEEVEVRNTKPVKGAFDWDTPND